VIHELTLYLLMILASYRLTRLVVRDTFPPILWLRDHLAGGQRKPTRAEMYHKNFPTGELEYGEHRMIPGLPGLWTRADGEIVVWRSHWKYSPHWLAELVTCPWCASAYVSGAVVLATDVTTGVPLPWLAGLATWAGAAWMLSKEKV
jgi:hypothetical protein